MFTIVVIVKLASPVLIPGADVFMYQRIVSQALDVQARLVRCLHLLHDRLDGCHPVKGILFVDLLAGSSSLEPAHSCTSVLFARHRTYRRAVRSWLLFFLLTGLLQLKNVATIKFCTRPLQQIKIQQCAAASGRAGRSLHGFKIALPYGRLGPYST